MFRPCRPNRLAHWRACRCCWPVCRPGACAEAKPPAAAAPQVAAAQPSAAPAPAAAGAGDVPSPLAGKVVSLDVAAGASVKAGDQILTLEAMKMNTIIYAPASGTLTAFCVNPGDTVQEGQALAKIG